MSIKHRTAKIDGVFTISVHSFLRSLLKTPFLSYNMKGYFVRFSSGTAMFVNHELQALGIYDYTAYGNRTLLLKSNINSIDLLQLKTVDDVFIHLTDFTIGHTKADLLDFKNHIQQLFLKKAIKQIRKTRRMRQFITFSITTSFKQQANYRQTDISYIFQTIFQQKYGWQFVENETDRPNHLSFRIIIENGHVLIGVRLGVSPLHRRQYKQFHQKGSLKPPLAYCMARLADIEVNEIVYDPTCGVGTTLIEAGLNFKPKRLIGTDINPLSLEAARRNAQLAGLSIEFIHQNALDISISKVDVILCNLPWGKQILTPAQVPQLYLQLLKKWANLLTRKGRIVVLTDKTAVLEKLVQQQGFFNITLAFPISIFGRHPTLYLLTVN